MDRLNQAGFDSCGLGATTLLAVAILLLAGCGAGGEGGGGGGGSTAANCGVVCGVNNVYVIGPGGGFYSYPICTNTCPPEPANQAPTANLAGPATLVIGNSTMIDSITSDANGDPLNYHWALLNRPAASSLTIVDDSVTDLPVTPDAIGRYLFSLVVDDGKLEADIQYHVLDVESDALPGFELTLVEAATFPDNAVGVALGDLDGDADDAADVAVGLCFGSAVGLINDGSGNFTAGAAASGLLGCSGAMVIGEFSGADAFADVLAYNQLLTSDGLGSFVAPAAELILAANNAIGDFNDDGFDDIVLVRAFSARGADDAAVIILHGDGDGNFTEAYSAYTPTEVVPLGVGDFNGDGIDDLAYYSILFDANENSELTVLFGDATSYTITTTITVTGRGALGVGDIDGNNDDDIVISYRGGTQPDIPFGMPSSVGIGFTTILGNGDGSFRAPRDVDAVNVSASNIAIYDFDDDSDVDFVFLGDTGAVNLLLGDGAGGIDDIVLLPGGGIFGGFAVGEVDGDTLPDILLTDDYGPAGNSGVLRIAFGTANQPP